MSLPADLAELQKRVRDVAASYRLDFFETVFELVDWRQMNTVAAYDGFPIRYPHWRFGMVYDQISKSYGWGFSKIYELVINNDPCYAYLLKGNALVDQKLVMAHVYAHCDFFKNNLWFAPTNRHMIDELASHASRIQRHVSREGPDEVEAFLDSCLCLENLIDIYAPYAPPRRRPREEEGKGSEGKGIVRFQAKPYMESFINPPDFIEGQKKAIEEARRRPPKFPERPERDLLWFLLEHAPLRDWQRDMLAMIREEAYYFAPQRLTKIANEGWACLRGDARVPTDRGLLTIREIAEDRTVGQVHDGSDRRRITDWARFEDRDTVRLTTRRGYEVEGSTTHRVQLPDGSWRRLDELVTGDRVRLAVGTDLWARERIRLDWRPRERLTLGAVAEKAGVSLATVLRHDQGRFVSRSAERIDPLLERYRADLTANGPLCGDRSQLRTPRVMDERLGSFLGYLLSDGNVSTVNRVVSLTTGDEEQAAEFASLAERLFGLEPRTQRQGNRIRVHLYSRHLIDFVCHLGLPTGFAAERRTVPDAILRSPKSVVSAFLRSYFDGDGYAGPAGVILITKSEQLARLVHVLLANFGVVATRRRQRADGCWRIHITGAAARTFGEEVNFGLRRKREALRRYVEQRRWFKEQPLDDEVISLERGRADVYDMTVEETHRYAAEGLVHHNSYWHSKMMTEALLDPSEVIDFAERHAGAMATQPGQINPYKLGIELFRDIEERWDKGQFGKEFEECDDRDVKRQWDTGLKQGRDKVFEVRRIYNDVTFVDEFLTREFCERQKLYTYEFNPKTGRQEIASRDWRLVKEKLLRSLANGGQPIIEVTDGNFKNRGEIVLSHRYDGQDLDLAQAKETLRHLYRLWSRPVHVETLVEGRRRRLSYDGETHEINDL
ncbi:MAG TPA: SpoVR family protein [Planctomycetota bacterium]|nr:SpoVR family protein [Planctomycetota bacterium]